MIRRRSLPLTPLVFVALMAALPECLALPTQVTARYVMSAQGLEVAQIRWRMALGGNGERIYESISESIGVARLIRNETVTERTRWQLIDGVVRPLEYTYTRRGGKRIRDASVSFDWDGSSALNTINGKTWRLKLTAGVQDKLSYLLSLMNHLERGERLERVQVTDGGKSKFYTFRYLNDETLKTALGKIDTVQVERRAEGDERVTLVWLAPTLDYFPVHMVHEEDGETVTIALDTVQGLTPP